MEASTKNLSDNHFDSISTSTPPKTSQNTTQSYKFTGSAELNYSTTQSNSLSKPDGNEDADGLVPEQNLTFTSPESAFYEYQQKMENQLCQVCKKSAAGFHHGAYVCEACKKFFMRHYLTGTKFTVPCPTGGRCNSVNIGRIKCQSCRFQKCLDVGMVIQNSNKAHPKFDISKIPCRVCGGRSSGFHFGALTCEGCKGFFRRTVNSRQPLFCSKGSYDCALIETNSRSMCKACRFKKCIEVGMSKKGSRIGRQPNAVKFHCVLEILHRKDSSQLQMSKPCYSSGNHTNAEMSSSNNDNKLKMSVDDSHGHEKAFTSQSSNQVTVNSDDFWESKTGEVDIDEDEDDKGEEANEQMDVDGDNTNEMFDSLEEKQEFMASIMKAIKSVDTSKMNLQRYSQENWNILSEYDNEDLWSFMMNYFDVHSAMIVHFAKSIPGFNNFPLKTRRTMVQDGMYPMMLLRLAGDYDTETNEYNYFDFSVQYRELILNRFSKLVKITQHILSVSQWVTKLGLSKLQLGYLSILELLKNNNDKENNEQVQEIMNKTKAMFSESIKNNYFESTSKSVQITSTSNDNSSVAKENNPQEIINECLIDLPNKLETMNSEHQEIIRSLREENPNLTFPELYTDMFCIH